MGIRRIVLLGIRYKDNPIDSLNPEGCESKWNLRVFECACCQRHRLKFAIEHNYLGIMEIGGIKQVAVAIGTQGQTFIDSFLCRVIHHLNSRGGRRRLCSFRRRPACNRAAFCRKNKTARRALVIWIKRMVFDYKITVTPKKHDTCRRG